MLGERHHRLHDVLDHQNCDAAPAEVANDRNDVADLGRVESGQHLVEQQQLGLGGERTRKLETLAGGDRQGIGGTIEHIGQAEIAADTVGNRKRGIARPMMKMCAHQDVLAHRQADKRLHDLEGARDAEARQLVRWLARYLLARIADRSLAGAHETGDDREQGRLAGAVRTDQRGDAAGRRGERRAVDGLQPAEPAAHVVDCEQRLNQGINHGAPARSTLPPACAGRRSSAHRQFRRSARAA